MKDKEKKQTAEGTEETEETVTSDTAPGDTEASAAPAEETAEDASALLQKQLAEEHDRYLRMAAEYDNYRRRSAKEREAAYGDAYADALMQIIPVIDNLERAAGFSGGDPAAQDAKQLADGVALILNQFKEVLKKLGIEEFGAEGDTFDPNIHNAIMHEDTEDLPENTVSAVFQKGYRRGDKIIRCAMVKVAN